MQLFYLCIAHMHTHSYSDDGLSFAYDCSLCGTVLGAVHYIVGVILSLLIAPV